MATPQYVYVMNKLSKTYPGGKQVLKDVTLAFLPGAKIGVVGVNGAGKSTLLRIMAGEETEFLGEAWAADGVSVGYLPQEPRLDDDQGRDRQRHGGRGREEGEARPLQRARHELFRRDRRRDGEAPGRDRRARPVGPRRPGRAGHGRAPLPSRRCRRRRRCRAARSAASRCASCCSPSPTSSCSTSRPTISTPRASPGSSIICATIPAP